MISQSPVWYTEGMNKATSSVIGGVIVGGMLLSGVVLYVMRGDAEQRAQSEVSSDMVGGVIKICTGCDSTWAGGQRCETCGAALRDPFDAELG